MLIGNCQIILQQGHTSLYSHQQWMSMLLGSLNLMYGKHVVELLSIPLEISRVQFQNHLTKFKMCSKITPII